MIQHIFWNFLFFCWILCLEIYSCINVRSALVFFVFLVTRLVDLLGLMFKVFIKFGKILAIRPLNILLSLLPPPPFPYLLRTSAALNSSLRWRPPGRPLPSPWALFPRVGPGKVPPDGKLLSLCVPLSSGITVVLSVIRSLRYILTSFPVACGRRVCLQTIPLLGPKPEVCAFTFKSNALKIQVDNLCKWDLLRLLNVKIHGSLLGFNLSRKVSSSLLSEKNRAWVARILKLGRGKNFLGGLTTLQRVSRFSNHPPDFHCILCALHP